MVWTSLLLSMSVSFYIRHSLTRDNLFSYLTDGKTHRHFVVNATSGATIIDQKLKRKKFAPI